MSDPLADKVLLLLPFEHTPERGSYLDRSAYGHPFVPVGDFRLSREQSRFGTWSARFGAGGSEGRLELPHDARFAFGTDDFCVEAWVYPQVGGGTYRTVVAKYVATTTGRSWSLVITDAGRVEAYCSSTGSSVDIGLNTGIVVTPEQWHHLALTREGATFRLFVNGVLGATATSAAALYNTTEPVTIGGGSLGRWLKGWIDGVRITRGAARYTANFEPPATEFEWADVLLTPMRLQADLLRLYPFADFNRRDPQPLTRTTTQTRFNPAPGVARRIFSRNVAMPYREGRAGVRLVGTVAIKGVPNHQPVSRPVRLYAQGSGLLIAQTRSDAQGHYAFDGLDPDERYFAVAFDTERWYRAVVADQLVPEQGSEQGALP